MGTTQEQPNYYEILGLAPGATPQEIRQAYLEAVRRWHPDRNKDPEAHEVFLLVREAYEVLSNPVLRRDYDQRMGFEGPITHTEPMTGTIPTTQVPHLRIRVSYETIPALDEPQVWYALLNITSPWSEPEQPHPVTLWFVLDQSNSMRKDGKMALQKAAVRTALDTLRPQDRVGLIGFHDRPRLLLPLTPVKERGTIESALEDLRPAGGTEIALALALAWRHAQQRLSQREVTAIWLFTDGRTYGDEEQALQLAKQWAKAGVICDAFGLGGDWNESFLEDLTAQTGGASYFLDSETTARQIIPEKIERFHFATVRRAQFDFSLAPQVELTGLYRMSPEVAHLPTASPVELGLVRGGERWLLLLELRLPPLQGRVSGQTYRVLYGQVRLTPWGRGSVHEERVPLHVRLGERAPHKPPRAVRHAVERLTWYRMQRASREALHHGEPHKARALLRHLAQRLTQRGRLRAAARVKQVERRLRAGALPSPEDEKALEYGTRLLMLPDRADTVRRRRRTAS
ncbi:MAG: DnaJ domain-containing protein [Chloroflexi bacterium]|nr:DnaJ domain-containing protein [Chloroflexota bacterium]